jgi:hypothetical protein
MHFSGTFRLPKVDMNEFNKLLDERLVRAITQGAREWLTAVIEDSTPRVGMPVWSAASRATFSPLASQAEFALGYAPVPDAPNRIDMGIGASPGDNGTFERGETPGMYSFTYSTSLRHLIINEYNNANTFLNKDGKQYFHLTDPGPYHFQEKGKAAFLKYAATVSLPDVPVFTATTITIG